MSASISTFYVGCDLGQATDYTALAIVEQKPVQVGEKITKGPRLSRPYGRSRLRAVVVEDVEPVIEHHYSLRHLERVALNTPYPMQSAHVVALVGQLAAMGRVEIVIDATGVGRGIVDYMRMALPNIVGVTITAGSNVGWSGLDATVPKRDLVGVLILLMQSARLRIAEGLALGPVLVQELLNFRMKVSVSGHDSYESWREGVHDDLVLATALAVWLGEDRAANMAWSRAYSMTRGN